MSGTGLEEKVENMNVDEKEANSQKGGKGAGNVSGEKKKKDEQSGHPQEVSCFTHDCMRVTP